MTRRGQTFAHGARRAFWTRGTTNTLNRLNNLSYEDTIEGIGYEEDNTTKQHKATNSNDMIAMTDNIEQFLESDNKMDQREQATV
jgi:hypothetical protein